MGGDTNTTATATATATGSSEITNVYQGWINKITEATHGMFGLATAIEQKSSAIALNIGLSEKGMTQLATNSTHLVDALKLSAKYNFDAYKYMEAQAGLSSKLQRNVGLSNQVVENYAAMSKVMGDEDAQRMVQSYDSLGMGVNQSIAGAEKLYKTASKYGLNFKEYSKSFLDNFTLAQKYNFKDGVNGLMNMAKKAQEVKLNMSETAQLAEKIWSGDLESTMTMSANLQVLGGPFSQFSDGLSMMNEAFNDMEGLQNRVTSMVAGMATYDKKTGTSHIGNAETMQIRAAAQAMGIPFEELMKSAREQARRNEVAKEINNYGGIDKDLKEKLMNVATFENGQMGANIGGRFYSVGEISASEKLQNEMNAESVGEEDNIASIAVSTQSILDLLKGNIGQVGNKAAQLQQSNWGELVNWAKNQVFGKGISDSFVNFMGAASNSVETFNSMSKALEDLTAKVDELVTKAAELSKSRYGSYVPKFATGGATGGLAIGPSHENGGITAMVHNKPALEFEGGEFIVNKKATEKFAPILESINSSTLNNSQLSIANTHPHSYTFANGGDTSTISSTSNYIEPITNTNSEVASKTIIYNNGDSVIYNNGESKSLDNNTSSDVNLKFDVPEIKVSFSDSYGRDKKFDINDLSEADLKRLARVISKQITDLKEINGI